MPPGCCTLAVHNVPSRPPQRSGSAHPIRKQLGTAATWLATAAPLLHTFGLPDHPLLRKLCESLQKHVSWCSSAEHPCPNSRKSSHTRCGWCLNVHSRRHNYMLPTPNGGARGSSHGPGLGPAQPPAQHDLAEKRSAPPWSAPGSRQQGQLWPWAPPYSLLQLLRQ